MREETRRRLDRVLMLQRLRWVGIALAVACALIGLCYLTNLDATVTDHRLAGHVERISIPISKNANQGVAVDVELDDGRHVQVLALKEHEPHVGDRVEVTEHRHATGRITFTWR
jgi:hypothetical protein